MAAQKIVLETGGSERPSVPFQFGFEAELEAPIELAVEVAIEFEFEVAIEFEFEFDLEG